MPKSISNRILSTPSAYARGHYLYVQEIGTLTSTEPHISSRQNLNSFLLLVVTDGNGYFTYEGKRSFIQTGDCVFVNCLRPYAHESSVEHPWTLTWVHFNGKDAYDLYQNYLDQGNASIFTPRSLSPFTDTLASLFLLQKGKSPLLELSSHKYLTDLVTLCFSENMPSLTGNDLLAGKLAQVRSYLEEHYAQKITLEQLSAHFYISKFHLTREYKKAYGVTVGTDLTTRRISHAKSLLRFSRQSVEQIALSCGFTDAGYFIKVFRKSENMTPLEYRKKW